ncbi:MAG: circularly permuted type 2 ATP-grasp protein [Campylobacteraceae bacterium]|nr:circularly permuted type 2 ATP-grasp protein [Campylobacteraceae bacterium]
MTFIDNYFSESSFDEMLDENKVIRQHWSEVLQRIETAGLDELALKQAEIDWHLEDNGVTYNVYNNPDGENDRPWRLDPIPFVLPYDEWNEIKRGIEQRAKLLNLILKDLYGERTLLKNKIIPVEVIFGHKGFIPEVYNLGKKENFCLHFYAVDIARGPDGKMWVISDKTQAPSGLGYAIENRLTMNSISKNLYPSIETKKLSLFIEEFKLLLKKLTKGDISKAALLTPGPHNETYFEHSYLSSFLEINLVQGDDLLCKNGEVWLKSLSGLKPINTILRRVDDKFCDPMELRNDSKLGVAGLVDVLRKDNVAMINPIGSAIVENIGLNPFMKNICNYFLQEELILPQIATWWCGQEKERAFVLENIHHLIIKKIDRTDCAQIYLGKNLSYQEIENLKALIIKNPYQYAAQEEIGFSTAPHYANGKIEPRNTVIRAYALKKEDAYTVMNGGLVRVSATNDTLLVSSGKGGSSKDLWILGEDEKIDTAYLFKRAPFSALSLNQLPTLRAENLFWLGRYLSRSIATMRFIRYVIKKLTTFYRFDETVSRESQRILQNTLTHLTMTYPGFLEEENAEKLEQYPMDEISSIIKDVDRQGSLSFTIAMLSNANINVKNLLAMESWKLFDKMQKEWNSFIRKSNSSSQTIVSELNKTLIYMMAYKELVEESMFKEQGLSLYSIGYKLESVLLLISKIRSTLCLKLDRSVTYEVLEGILNSCESFNAYRTQYKSSLHLENVIEFLILNPLFPKSITYISEALLQELKELPKSKQYLSAYEKPIFEAYSLLKLIDLSTLLELKEGSLVYETLDNVLLTIQKLFLSCADEMSRTYFSHDDE